ncbi:hypothetical protein QUB68_03735 [Microcoleus sp. A006_D1]
MNSLILIDPDQGSGFKPILSGKYSEMFLSAAKLAYNHQNSRVSKCPIGN